MIKCSNSSFVIQPKRNPKMTKKRAYKEKRAARQIQKVYGNTLFCNNNTNLEARVKTHLYGQVGNGDITGHA